VRFDDRLLTVLNQPAADERDCAVRWRQLVDLVARAGANTTSPTVQQALETIRADAAAIDERLRAAAARAVAALPLPLELLEYFASAGLAVASPVLAAATLETDQWRLILAGADEETRRFVEALHPKLSSESMPKGSETLSENSPELTDELIERVSNDVRPGDGQQDAETIEAEVEPAGYTADLEGDLTDAQVERQIELIAEMVERPSDKPTAVIDAPSLQEVVERIERRRRSRSIMRRRALTPSVQTTSSLFRWECGPGGEISWVDGAPRGALIGRSIARTLNGEGDRIDREAVRAFTVRAPFRDARFTIAGEGVVSGEWKISGVPAFDAADGRFRGYRGIAMREQSEVHPPDPAVQALADPDSLRELVHEIKTPLNAIIGFAEIIEGQYLGPADRRYRERAQEIVQQARLLLLAIDDLDFAAKVHSSAASGNRRVNLTELIERIVPALRDVAASSQVEIDSPGFPRAVVAQAQPEIADRLIFRMCSALIQQAAAGERLRLSVERSGERWRLSMTRPAALSALTEEQLLGGEDVPDEGFPLRLVRGLAGMAGADVDAPQGKISLLFHRA
jgi:signal transduction histidine kinase